MTIFVSGKLKAHLAQSNDKPMRTLGYKSPRQTLLEKLTDNRRIP